jgi:hypothetical protein
MSIGTRLLLGGLAFALVAFPAWAAKKDLIPPPQGKTQGVVEVMRGGRASINLLGLDRNKRPLKFVIDQPPRFGKLGAISMTPGSLDQGTVIYTHGDDDDSTEDSFVFTVRAASGGPAGRATVKIRILDQPATLLAPAELDFGEVVTGETAQRRFEISNFGGGLLEGDLEAPEPFQVQGPGEFLLKRGARRNFTVNFSPTNPGPYTFRMQPSPHDPAIIQLKGEALPPFFVRAVTGIFNLLPDDTRTAAIEVRNNSSQPLTLAIKVPLDVPVESPGQLKLASAETRTIELRFAPSITQPWQKFPVQFIGPNYTEVCELSAPAIPARLLVLTEPDFGEIAMGRTAEAKLVVRNNGGLLANFEVQADDTLRLLDAPPAISLPPGATREIGLQLRLQKNETRSPSLRLMFQGDPVPVAVRFRLAEPAPPATPPVNPPVAEPAPPPPPYALDQDITLVRDGETARLEWIEKQNWSAYHLQHRPPDSGLWVNYQPPRESEELLAWLASLPQKIRGFLDTPIQREEQRTADAEKRGGILLDSSALNSGSLWRLCAVPGNSAEPENLTSDFLINTRGLTPAPLNTPVPATAEPVESRLDTSSSPPPAAELETRILSAGIRSEKHAADLQVVLDRDLDVVNFRLERGAMSVQIDSADGIPRSASFTPIAHEEGKAAIKGFSQAESEGKQVMTVAGRIEGLPPGTRTYWRLVPVTQNGERPPTTVLLVDTIPVPPFPWRNFFLWTVLAMLAGVIYLRWRINRGPK